MPLRWIVIGPFLVMVLLLAALVGVSTDMLSAMRAIASSESQYGQATQDAIEQLGRSLGSQAPADLGGFEQALAGPLSEREARLELARPQPDAQRVRDAFVRAHHNPQDIGAITRLYGTFASIAGFDAVPDIRAERDAALLELEAIGQQLRLRAGAGAPQAQAMAQMRLRVAALDLRLRELNRQFAKRLGAASRGTARVAWLACGALAALLVLMGVLLPWQVRRRQAATEQAIRQSNERWQRTAAAANIGVFELDMAQQRLVLDARGAALYGAVPPPPGTMHIQALDEGVHPQDLAHLRAGLQQATLQPQELRYRIFRADGRADVEAGDLANGRLRHLELNAHPGPRRGTRPPMVVGILWDVTEDVRAERLRLEKEAAERANQSKSEFLSRVSHELRTPLNGILGFAQLLELDDTQPLSPRQHERVRHVLECGRHLLALIDDVLDLTSIDQRTMIVSTHRVDLCALVRESLTQVETMALAGGIRLHAELAPDGVPAMADARRLRKVFVNLLSNAIKYNRAGGQVTVYAGCEGGHGIVSVRDTGVGMSAAQVQGLFQPFNRLGAEHSGVPGTGLGLVIVKQLVDRMAGRIEVVSAPGAGSTFTASFLLAPDAHAAPAPGAKV